MDQYHAEAVVGVHNLGGPEREIVRRRVDRGASSRSAQLSKRSRQSLELNLIEIGRDPTEKDNPSPQGSAARGESRSLKRITVGKRGMFGS